MPVLSPNFNIKIGSSAHIKLEKSVAFLAPFKANERFPFRLV